MKVKPNPGKLMRDPVTRMPLPAEGKEVPNNSFWRRRIKDGDVIAVPDGPLPAPATKPEPINQTADDVSEPEPEKPEPTPKKKAAAKKKAANKKS